MVVKIQVVVFFIVLLTILTYFFVREPKLFFNLPICAG